MMAKKVCSVKNFWGGETLRDTHGKKIGESYHNFWGELIHRDATGKRIGRTRKSFWGETKTELDDRD